MIICEIPLLEVNCLAPFTFSLGNTFFCCDFTHVTNLHLINIEKWKKVYSKCNLQNLQCNQNLARHRLQNLISTDKLTKAFQNPSNSIQYFLYKHSDIPHWFLHSEHYHRSWPQNEMLGQ